MVMLFHACLTHLSVVRLCFSQRLPGPPADRANVLRALSSPSLHKLAQKTFHYCTCCRVGKGQARQFFFLFKKKSFMFLSVFFFVVVVKTAGEAEVLCNSLSTADTSA